MEESNKFNRIPSQEVTKEMLPSHEDEDDAAFAMGDYLIVRAEENGVTIMGLTRGKETRFHHNEKLDNGEVMIFQFTQHTSAIKIRGKALIYSRHGVVKAGF